MLSVQIANPRFSHTGSQMLHNLIRWCLIKYDNSAECNLFRTKFKIIQFFSYNLLRIAISVIYSYRSHLKYYSKLSSEHCVFY